MPSSAGTPKDNSDIPDDADPQLKLAVHSILAALLRTVEFFQARDRGFDITGKASLTQPHVRPVSAG
jgi:hypothetical protein